MCRHLGPTSPPKHCERELNGGYKLTGIHPQWAKECTSSQCRIFKRKIEAVDIWSQLSYLLYFVTTNELNGGSERA